MSLLQNQQQLVVTQANALAHSIQVMSLYETRIIRTVIAVITRNDKKFWQVRIYIPELCKIFDLHNSHSIYEKLENAINQLLGRVVTIERGRGSWKKFQWVSRAEYTSGSDSPNGIGYMDILVHDDMAEFLLELESHFFSYPLKNIAPIQSQYSIRMYELLLSDSHSGNIKSVHYELMDLKMRLGCENSYKNFKDLRINVIDKAKYDCQKYTNLHFEYRETRLGRKVTGLTFDIHLTSNPILKGSTALTGELDDDAVLERIGLQNDLLQAGFEDNPSKYIDDLGVDYVRNILIKSLEDFKKAKHTKNPIRNLGGYIHSKLKYALTIPPQERAAATEEDKRPKADDIRRIAETLSAAFDNARMDHMNTLWNDLPEVRREELKELMWVVLPRFNIDQLGKSGWSGPLFDSARREVLSREGLLTYPEQLQSVQAYVQHEGFLVEYDDSDRKRIVQEASNYIVE